MRCLLVFAVLASAALAPAQRWLTSYEAGLNLAGSGNWKASRDAFLQAVVSRPDDQSTPTEVFGAITEKRSWRNGAPYSPNFLAAYAGYRVAEKATEDERKALYPSLISELETLHAKQQAGPYAYFLLLDLYGKAGDRSRRDAFIQRYPQPDLKWREDTAPLDPAWVTTVNQSYNLSPNTGTVMTPGAPIPGGEMPPNTIVIPATTLGGVAQITTKFALIVGNSESMIPGAGVPFAAADAQLLRETLSTVGGYPEANIETVVNGTSRQVLATAGALAERMPEGATVLIYFTGSAAPIGDRDYLGGVDAESLNLATGMISKAELYRTFFAKSANIFAFYQVARPRIRGRYFGSETVEGGSSVEMQATTSGDGLLSVIRNGKPIGVFTDAFTNVLTEFRSNRIPIYDFGWQVFRRLRTGNTGNTGGSSQQTPTLPVFSRLANDARF
jgi:hypothetical protein